MLFALFAVVLLGCEPQYSHDRPDTEPNRAGFQKHFGFPAPDSVSNLYYFADALGADVKYQLGFSADGAVIQEIVDKHQLTEANDETHIPTAREFDWWVSDEVKMLPVYWKKTADKEYYRYLWYSKETMQAYYLEYSL